MRNKERILHEMKEIATLQKALRALGKKLDERVNKLLDEEIEYVPDDSKPIKT